MYLRFRSRRVEERASVSLVVAALLVLVSLLAVGLAHVGFAVVESATAQAGADAVALAGVRGGREMANRVAHEHGLSIVEWSPQPHRLTVVVTRASGFEARSIAEFADDRQPVTIEWWESTADARAGGG